MKICPYAWSGALANSELASDVLCDNYTIIRCFEEKCGRYAACNPQVPQVPSDKLLDNFMGSNLSKRAKDGARQVSALRDPAKCPWMSLSELAELIGVSRMTIHNWLIHSPHRLPPAIQLTPGNERRRGVTRFRRVDVAAWLKEHTEAQMAQN